MLSLARLLNAIHMDEAPRVDIMGLTEIELLRNSIFFPPFLMVLIKAVAFFSLEG